MKQRFIWMLAAILTLSGTLVGLTSIVVGTGI